MTCRDVSMRGFDLPLVQPLATGTDRLLSRQGLYLDVTDDLGHRAVGECAPLPGWSAESLEQAHAQLQGLVVQLRTGPLPEAEAVRDLFPSVRMALDMARMDLAWQRSGFFAGRTDLAVPLNGLIMGPQDRLMASLGALLDQGYTSIKIKVARASLAEDIEMVKRVKALVQGRACLRLDANRTWSLEQACSFARAVGCNGIEYIEEPTQMAQDHRAFWQRTGMAVALDESLYGQSEPDATPAEGIRAFVLKPTLLGGAAPVDRLIERARQLNIPAVLSSVFESPVALGFYAKWVIARGLAHHAHGLDTWRWLAIAKETLPFDPGQGRLIL